MKTSPFIASCFLSGLSLAQFIQYLLQVLRQLARELHSAAVDGVLEREPRGVQERPVEVCYRTQVSGYPPVNASVQWIANDRMADGAQVDPNLVRAAGLDGDMDQCERAAEMLRACDSRHRFARAPRPGGHFLAVHEIAADRRIDPATRHH